MTSIEKNKKLCEEYPFIVDNEDPRNDENEKTYEYTILDDMPSGWKIAFGEQLCREIKEALLEDGIPIEEYSVSQVKEKFGGLRWYDNLCSGKVQEVIRKYEDISRRTCNGCGAEATVISRGYILPFCDKCKNEVIARDNYITEGDFKPITKEAGK